MKLWDRRAALAGLGGAGAALWLPPAADALGLPQDKIKAVHYYTTPGDAQGRQGQPMVNQSTNVVIIETQSGLKGIGDNLYLETPASGTPQNGTPQLNGFGDLQQGNLEQANVEAVSEISDLIAAQRAYEMNAKVISAADQMLQSTSNLMR